MNLTAVTRSADAARAPQCSTLSPRAGAWLRNGVLLLLAFVTVMPFLWAISTSFKPSAAIYRWPPEWIPHRLTLEHYRTIFSSLSFGRLFMNSLFVSLTITCVSLVLNSMGGYVFAKFEFPGKRALFAAFILTLMLPSQVTLIPVFLLLKSLGLLNHYASLILPGAMSVFGVFLMRQFISTIPNEYAESARIDGCGELRLFWGIILPLARPALGALAILTFTAAWSDFMMPLIVMQEQGMYTLPVGLANLNGQHTADWGILMAGATITIVPIAVLFLAFHRWIINNVAAGGLKG